VVGGVSYGGVCISLLLAIKRAALTVADGGVNRSRKTAMKAAVTLLGSEGVTRRVNSRSKEGEDLRRRGGGGMGSRRECIAIVYRVPHVSQQRGPELRGADHRPVTQQAVQDRDAGKDGRCVCWLLARGASSFDGLRRYAAKRRH
jgi:hypothetical protein